jgi:hypothetical protein
VGIVGTALVSLLYLGTALWSVDWASTNESGEMWSVSIRDGAFMAEWEDLRNSGNDYYRLPKGLEIDWEPDSLIRFNWAPSFTWEAAEKRACIPLWIPLVFTAATVLYARPRGNPPGHCRGCGYNLTGNVSGRCPECGTTTADAKSSRTVGEAKDRKTA